MGARVGALTLRSPVLTASGTSGHGAELSAYMDLSALGAVVTKSVSADPWAGNPSPRLAPLEAGMLNSVGLDNPGVQAWLATDLPPLAATGATVVASVWGRRTSDYRAVAATLAAARADGRLPGVVAVEANISCPNVEDRRRIFAHDPDIAAEVTAAAAAGLEGSGLPLWVKLSPNVTDLPTVAVAVVGAGADALTLVNTMMGLALDPATGTPRLGNGGGGLSGPALHPVAVRAVYECRAALPDVPIVGVGGVARGVDAAEMMAAGADAVQVGTATFADPRAPARVAAELRRWCAQHRIGRMGELVGRAHGR